jgi:predicted transcriptional regulator
MANTKMTNKGAIDFVLETFGGQLPEDVAEKLTNMRASLNKKSANKKATKTQEENKVHAEVVASILADGKARTITEILKADESFADLSNQKMTAIVRGMVNDGKVIKSTEGRKSVFSLAE